MPSVTTASFIQKEVKALEQMADECAECTDEEYCPTHQQIVTGYQKPDREWN